MAATSVHKLGGSLTQSSILNLRGNLVSPKRVQSVLCMLTTTSTSYLLLASLDVARKSFVTEGQGLLEDTIRKAKETRSKINEIPHLYCMGHEVLESSAAVSMNPTKLLISVEELGITGNDVEKWLRHNYNIEVELSDLYKILCIVTPGDTDKDLLTLLLR